MPYDLYERHAVISRLLQEILKNRQESICILDVGGRAELLERFMPYRVISVNTNGSGNLIGSGCSLPLVDSSFTAVVSMDTLEHLPQKSRLPFLRECLRVAQRYLVVAAPFGSAEHSKCEKRLDKLYRSIYGTSHIYLSEHVKYGLPDIVELDQFTSDLEAANFQRFFAGDYVWQGKQFERATLGHRKQGVHARLWNIYNYVISSAIFHPIRLREQPDVTANRFYLLVEKKCTDTCGE
jgi:hypothetical protein